MRPHEGPAVRFVGVSVTYESHDTPAIDGLDLVIEPGESVALVGPSGAGKSTIISLANGLIHPTEGTVEVLGRDSRDLGRRHARSLRRRIGTVPQQLALVGPLRVVHNVAAGRLGQWGAGRALRSLVRPVDLDEIVSLLDQLGIADKLWDRVDQLSGGQQQRVAIARMLFQGPDLHLADEPASSLDPAWSEAVLKIMSDACASGQARTLVASLHDAPLAQSYASRIIGLRTGQVVFDEPAGAVTPEMLDDLYALDA